MKFPKLDSNANRSNNMAKSIARQIAEHFGCDVADIRDYEYQPGTWSRKVYAGMDGNRYWSTGGTKPPRYCDEEGGITWRSVKSNWPGNPDLWVGESH
jgi:hypothetical protein